jgi:predicted hydrocarbon binding protein
MPAGLRGISLLAIEKTFGYDDKGIRNVCAYHPKTSLIINLFAKYIYSVPKVMKKAQEMWSKYWTVGKFKFIEFNDKKRYAIVRIEDFDLDSIFCRCEEGYFASVTQIILGEKNVTCHETKCAFKGEKYHEFTIKW